MTTGYVRNFSTFYHDIYYLTGQKIQPLYYAIIALCAFLFIYLFSVPIKRVMVSLIFCFDLFQPKFQSCNRKSSWRHCYDRK